MSTRNRSSRIRGNFSSGHFRRRAVISAAVLTGAACLLPRTSLANTDTWTGLSGININWGTPGNWSTTNSGGIPLTDDLLNFNGSSSVLTSIDNISGLTVDGIAFTSGAGAYVLNGSSPLMLDTSYETAASTPTFTGGNITNSNAASATTETINAPITFTGGVHTVVTTANSGGLAFGGAITTGAGTSVQFTTAGGAINLTNSGLSTTNGILGGWATIGNSLATLNGSGNVVAYTGATSESASFNASAASVTNNNVNITASGGTLLITPTSGDSYVDFNAITWTPSSASAETIESSSTSIPLRLGVQGVIMNTNAAAGSLNIGSGYTLTAGGPNLNTNGTLYLVDLTTAGVGNAGGNIGIKSTVVDNGTGHVSVVCLGSVNFAAVTNTYSGGTYIESGDCFVNNGVLGTGSVYVYGGGRADYGNNNNATVSNNFYIEGYGFVSGSTNNPGAIKCPFKGSITGNIVLLGNASIDPNNSATAFSTISGTISGNGSFTVGGANSGLVGGAITLGGILSYTGDTIIDNTANKAAIGINISSGANNIMPNGSLTGNLDIIGGSSQATTFQLDGTTQTINGLSTPSGTLNNAIVTSGIAGGVLTLGGNNATAVFGGNLTGSANLSLIKIGGGTQTLGGNNTYTGSTNISNGVLSITNSLASSSVNISGGTLAGTATLVGAVTLNNGGINPGALGAGSIGTLTLNNGLTINSGNLGFDLGASTNDHVTVSGNVINFAAASTLTPSGGTPGLSYNVMSGTMTGSFVPTLVEPIGTTRFSYTYGTSSYNGSNGSTMLVIVVNGAIGNLTWNNAAGGDGSRWDVVGQNNWTSSATVGNPNEFYQGDNVTFNDSNNGNYNVLITTTVNPGSVTVSTNGAYSIRGAGTIGGTAPLSMTSPSGTGSLLLATSNVYSGGTTLNSGTLFVNNANALGTGTLNISGGSIDNTSAGPITIFSIPQIWNSNFTFAGTQSLNMGTGPVSLTSSPVVTVNNNTLTVGGNITGAGQSLTKTGNGALVLTGLSNYSGGTTVNGGTLTLANGGGTGAIIGTLNINSGATVVASVTNAFGFSAGSLVTSVNITGGLLNYTATSDLGWAIAYNLSGGTMASNGGVSSTNTAVGDFDFGGFSGDDTTVTTLANSTTSVIAGRINLRGDNSNPNVTFNVAQGTVTAGPTPGVDLLVSAGITQSLPTAGGQGIVLTGTGVMSLTGANNYTGATNISGGTLSINNLASGGVASSIGASTNAAGNVILNGGTLQYTGPAQTTDRLFTLLPAGGAIDASGTGALNFTNPGSVNVFLTGNRTLTLTGTNTGNNILAPAITDSQSNDGSQTSVTKNGVGSWTLGGSNTYTGPTTVNQGTLTIGSTGSIAGGGAQVNGGTFAVNGTMNSPVSVASGATLAGSGTVNGAVNISSGGILTGGSSGSGALSLTNGLNLGANSGDTETINALANAASPASPGINVSRSTVTVNGNAHSVVINVGQVGILTPGEYELVSYGNGSIAGTGNTAFVLGTLPNRVIGTLDFNYAAGAAIDLKITGIDFPVWTGAKNGNWVTSATATTGESDNWVLNSNHLTTTDFILGDTVLFSDIAATGNVNISGGSVQPSVITFDNSSVAYNILSNNGYGITGNTPLTKMGTASLTISTSNTYTGGTTLLAGTLNINSASALGTGVINLLGGNLNINNASALGTGTLNISGGSFDNTTAASITLATNNPQVWSGNFTFVGTQGLNMGTGNVLLNSNTNLNVSSNTLAVPGNISNVSSGTTLTKTGAGTLILSGSNTFNGGVIINAGTVQVTTSGGGSTGLGGAPNGSGGPTIVNTGATLIGGGNDAFGYYGPMANAPSSIDINGGTVTDLGTSSYRITLLDVQMTGGTLTSDPLNSGAANGNYSLYAGTIETNPSSITSVISAQTISIQTQNTNGSAAFTIAQGTTASGIDLVVSSNLENFGGETNGVNKNGPGVMELSGSNTYTGGTTVSGGTLVFALGASLPAIGTLTINGGTTAQILPHAANASATVLTVPYLNSNGLLDLTNNAIIVVDGGGGIGGLTTAVQQGYNGGTWDGTPGITSSTAAGDTTHLTAVGIILNDNGSSQPLYGPGGTLATNFEGAYPVDGEVLLKYTYYGDTNLDGKVDGSDYGRIDAAYLYNMDFPDNPMTGWYNGDFNYDGVIDGSDYTLMDNAFNNQGASLSAAIASVKVDSTAQIAESVSATAVPEPATSALIGVTAFIGLLGRKRRPERR